MPENPHNAAHRALVAFEAEADKAMAGLSIWGLPFRSIYSNMHLIADSAFSGGRFNADRRPDVEKGATTLARLSQWRPYFSLAGAEIGRDLEDALGA
ncbi:hypothetical protein [Rhizobium mongolense]